MTLRVVFDTNVVLSALCFQSGRLAWLRAHWASAQAQALVSPASIEELIQTLAYPKFRLTAEDIQGLLSDYLPHVEVVREAVPRGAPRCRDSGDQKFVDLALAGGADVLVTGDKDLLAMRSNVPFAVESPAEYRRRFAEGLP